VSEGSDLAMQAGETMDEIASEVMRMTKLMREIASASQEQSRGIEQVNIAVSQMDETAQQNAALVQHPPPRPARWKSSPANCWRRWPLPFAANGIIINPAQVRVDFLYRVRIDGYTGRDQKTHFIQCDNEALNSDYCEACEAKEFKKIGGWLYSRAGAARGVSVLEYFCH
jgi:hypothetical protein